MATMSHTIASAQQAIGRTDFTFKLDVRRPGQIESLIEALISFLDHITSDADLEPTLGWPEEFGACQLNGEGFLGDDREHDDEREDDEREQDDAEYDCQGFIWGGNEDEPELVISAPATLPEIVFLRTIPA